MEIATRIEAELFICKKFSLCEPWKAGFDSTCWLDDSDVLKVSLLDENGVNAHEEFLKEGKSFPHIAPIVNFEIICKSTLYSDSAKWFFCLIKQKLIKKSFLNAKLPPTKWIFKNAVWYQFDATKSNAINGVWVDTVRIKKLKTP